MGIMWTARREKFAPHLWSQAPLLQPCSNHNSIMCSCNMRRKIIDGKLSQNSFLEGLEGSERDSRSFKGRETCFGLWQPPGCRASIKVAGVSDIANMYKLSIYRACYKKTGLGYVSEGNKAANLKKFRWTRTTDQVNFWPWWL